MEAFEFATGWHKMIVMRKALERDSRDLYLWRNDATSRAVSGSVAEVSWADHIKWFSEVLVSDNRFLYMAEIAGTASETFSVGMCRFDREEGGGRAEVSINLNPAERGKGYAGLVLQGGVQRFRVELDKQIEILAKIKSTNIASIRVFEAAGFRLTSEGGGYKLYTL